MNCRHLAAYFTLLSSGCTFSQIRSAQKGEIQSLVFETHFNVYCYSSHLNTDTMLQGKERTNRIERITRETRVRTRLRELARPHNGSPCPTMRKPDSDANAGSGRQQ